MAHVHNCFKMKPTTTTVDQSSCIMYVTILTNPNVGTLNCNMYRFVPILTLGGLDTAAGFLNK